MQVTKEGTEPSLALFAGAMSRSLHTALFIAFILAHLGDDAAAGASSLHDEKSRDISVGEGRVRRALSLTTNLTSRERGAELGNSSQQQQVANENDRHLLASEAPSVARLLAVTPLSNYSRPFAPKLLSL